MYDDLELLSVTMIVIEIGNAINKLLFWWRFGGEIRIQSRKKATEKDVTEKKKVE